MHVPRNENVSSSDTAEMTQGPDSGENFRTIFFFPSPTYPDRYSKPRSFMLLKHYFMTSVTVNTNKVESILTTECLSPKILVPQDSKLCVLKSSFLVS